MAISYLNFGATPSLETRQAWGMGDKGRKTFVTAYPRWCEVFAEVYTKPKKLSTQITVMAHPALYSGRSRSGMDSGATLVIDRDTYPDRLGL